MIAEIAKLAAANPVLVGLVGAGASASLFFALKAVPVRLWELIQDQLTVTLVVRGDEHAFAHVNMWLARHGGARRARRLVLAPDYDYERSRWRWEFSLGMGWHLIWFAGRPVLVNREIKDSEGLSALLGSGATQRLWLRSVGRSQAALRRLIDEAERVYSADGRVQVYFWHQGAYRLADRRRPRSLATVFMPAAQKARLVEDLERFAAAEASYARTGTPWRRGYLLTGPPGTGKTTLVFAVATLLKRAVYIINLANCPSDADLIAAFNEAPVDGVVAIEDLDAAKVTRARELVEQERQQAVVAGLPAAAAGASQGVTLSGLLNAMDGIAAREGRILFVTTNHPEHLDAALLRPGRIDVREEIGPMDRETAREMVAAYRPGWSEAEFEARVAARLPMTGAELQGLLQTVEAAS